MNAAMRKLGWPKLARDTIGMRVTTNHELQNGFVVVPAGYGGTVTGAYRWVDLSIKFDPCECCGVRPHMSRVSFRSLTPVKEEEKAIG